MCKTAFRMAVLVVVLAAALTGPRAASAAVIIRHAKPTGGLNTGSCSTWATACTLQRALGVALAGDQVWVKKGIYRPSTSLIVKSGVKVYGGFDGTETGLTARNPGMNLTILSGDTGIDDLNTDGNFIAETTDDILGTNMGPVIDMYSTSTPITAATVLDGFTITAGYNFGWGGGLHCHASLAGSVCSPTLARLVFSGNYSGVLGGGMANNTEDGGIANPTLENVLFRGNRAYECGGLGNWTDSSTSSPAMNNVTFNGNSAAAFGGAMCNLAVSAGGISSPTMTGGAFNNNSAGLHGGAVANETGGGTSKPKFANVTFRGNHAASGGGAIFDYSGEGGSSSPAFTNVTFVGNHTVFSGGAIYNDAHASGASSPALINVTFYGNWADQGGAMYNSARSYATSSPQLKNVTFYGNSAMTSGGAMYSSGTGGASSPAFTNAILWGQLAPDGRELYNVDATPTMNYSILKGGDAGIGGNSALTAWSSGAGNLNTDPLLNVLGTYGGATQTMPLKKASPAIDHGTNTGCPLKDQRGIPRPSDGDGNGTKICDMGATEARFVSSTLQSSAPYDGWLLESGENSNVGGSHDASATAFYLGDDEANKQYRAVLSFNTAAIPDTATIISATLRIRKFAQVGSNPFNSLGNIIVDIKKGAFGTNPALENSDFQAAATKSGVAAITNSPSSTGWYTKAFASTTLPYFNETGITQLRLRFGTGDNNNHVADYLKFYSGNYGTASSRPQLLVRYYVP